MDAPIMSEQELFESEHWQEIASRVIVSRRYAIGSVVLLRNMYGIIMSPAEIIMHAKETIKTPVTRPVNKGKSIPQMLSEMKVKS